jgi:hypothetical protein
MFSADHSYACSPFLFNRGLALVLSLWDPGNRDLVWLIVLVLVLGFFQGELIYKYEEVIFKFDALNY